MNADKMKKLIILSFIGLLLITVLFAFRFSGSHEHSASNAEQSYVGFEQTNRSKRHNGYERFIKLVDSFLLAMESNAEYKDIFSDQQLLIEVGSVVNQSVRYLDRNKGVQNFRASGLDSVKNYSASLEQLKLSYKDDSDADFLRKRVTAIRFLEFSQHLSSNDCINLMKQMISNLEQSFGEQMQRNLKLDLYELSQACGRHDRGMVAAFANDLENVKARNTILLGLERVNRD